MPITSSSQMLPVTPTKGQADCKHGGRREGDRLAAVVARVKTPPVCGNTGVPSGMGSPDADGSGVASGGMAGEGAGVGEGVGEGVGAGVGEEAGARRLCWGRRYRFGWGWGWVGDGTERRRRRRWLDRKADKVERKSIDDSRKSSYWRHRCPQDDG